MTGALLTYIYIYITSYLNYINAATSVEINKCTYYCSTLNQHEEFFFFYLFIHCLLLSVRDEEMDGEWEAPQIPNPACETAPGCGVWKRPMIDNPNYKGKWKPPMIDNPNYQVSL